VLNPPWRFSATPARVDCQGPCLGEHNRYVFGELLGIPQEEIERLERDGVLY